MFAETSRRGEQQPPPGTNGKKHVQGPSLIAPGGARERTVGEVAPQRIAICVPARNEAAALPALFAALDRLAVPEGIYLSLCLFLDGCTDNSARLARGLRAAASHRVMVVAGRAACRPNAGRARHRAMLLGFAALGGEDGLLLTTDADSSPAPDWLVAMHTALGDSDVVAGRIARAGSAPAPLQDRLEGYYDALFALRRRLDPVAWEAEATHHHSGGANMGFRAGAYRRLGGFAPVANGEDALILDDAARAGLRVRRDAAALVHTSDRRWGRASGGLALALRDLDRGDAAEVRVAHPADAAWQYAMHARARAAFPGDLAALATALDLTGDHLLGVARDCPNAEAFAMRVVPTPGGGMRQVPLAVAEAELARLAGLRHAA